jgi:tetratricopeptide (TPR) repeat protein
MSKEARVVSFTSRAQGQVDTRPKSPFADYAGLPQTRAPVNVLKHPSLVLGNAQDCLMSGMMHCESGAFSEAYVYFKRCVELDPNNAIALYYMGNICTITGDPDAAHMHYQIAIAADPDFPLTYYSMGKMLEPDPIAIKYLAHFITVTSAYIENANAKTHEPYDRDTLIKQLRQDMEDAQHVIEQITPKRTSDNRCALENDPRS